MFWQPIYISKSIRAGFRARVVLQGIHGARSEDVLGYTETLKPAVIDPTLEMQMGSVFAWTLDP